MKRFLFLLFIPISLISQTNLSTTLANAAASTENQNIIYNPVYFSIDYPNGDIPSKYGVCTDVVIRAYRKIGIDLQKVVHEDMIAYFNKYPNIWGLNTTDKNIDHRRVPNIMTFFSRHGKTLAKSKRASDYKPGDIVCWSLGSGITHIGILTNQKSKDGKRHLIIHNIGSGQIIEDFLFEFPIIGHYSYKK